MIDSFVNTRVHLTQDYLPFDPDLKKVNFVLPKLSCDCHFHIFDDPEKYPFQEPRSYTPTPAPLDAYTNLMRAYGIERAIYIQPSVYGSDHTLMEDLLETNSSWLRAVAVTFPDTLEKKLLQWHELGVRGTRCNALFAGGISTTELKDIVARVRPYGWHIQLCVDIAKDPKLAQQIGAFNIPVVIDHFGHFPIRDAGFNRGFANLLSLVKEGNTWVKLSGPYRVSPQRSGFSDCQWATEELLKANSNRLIWGSDWPHPAIAGPMVNDGDLVEALHNWIGTEYLTKVLVSNPSKLYWSS